ncbi:hypothetical protein A7P54_03820 [Acinetobacter sp. Ac_3412]|nr:hypothetical protein [Acinetobacter sp. Ac_3412]
MEQKSRGLFRCVNIQIDRNAFRLNNGLVKKYASPIKQKPQCANTEVFNSTQPVKVKEKYLYA